MAEVVVGLLTSAVVKIANDKLNSAIAEQANLLWSFSSDLCDMKDTMESIAAVLKDAERRSIKEESARLWLKRLKHAAYDISDMMDECQNTDTQATTAKLLGIFSCHPGVLSVRKKILLANKMKNMRGKLSKINDQHRRYDFTPSTSASVDHQLYDPRKATPSAVDDAQIIGREKEMQEIIRMLCASENKEDTVIVPIYGLGGMGKSTLVRLVYEDNQIVKNYDHRVWVHVSLKFDMKKIGRSVISQIQKEEVQTNIEMELINQRLKDLVSDKKILIVLDDIWEENDFELEELKRLLRLGKKGCMIDVIVTTRKEAIAKKICAKVQYKLEALQEDMCWNIIKKYSQLEDNTEQFEPIGKEIAKKCGGLPLAAQALGYILKFKDLNGWSDVNDNDIWNSSYEDKTAPQMEVLPSLNLSYESMPPRLRLCFSYCAIFPKAYEIVEDDLIHQWVSLDFIKPSEGKEYITQLLGMSFLQHSKLPLISGKHVVVRYTMHDLVHDLARSVIDDELIVIDAANKSNTKEQKLCRYALLKNYDGQKRLSNILPQQVRALHFSDSSKLDLITGASFSFAKCLRILDFSECSSILLPASIGHLKKLRCLIAPRMQNEMLPDCFAELSQLQYLNLRGSSQISALPESIGKLGALMYLGLSGCSSITKLPASFGDLKCMVHLDMSGCSGIRELPCSLGNLTNLQHLELLECSGVMAIPNSLCGLTKVQHLNLSYCDQLRRLPEDIGSLVNLQYLSMFLCRQIRELPESFEKLRNLLHLDLGSCSIVEGLPRALRGLSALQHLNLSQYRHSTNKRTLFGHGAISDALGNLTNLKYLSLQDSMRFLFHQVELFWCLDFIGSLTHLEHLDLSHNHGLPVVCLPESISNLKRLHTLNLSYSNVFKSLPGSICAIRLKSLLIEHCSDELIDQANSLLHYSLTLPLFKVRADDASGRSNLHLLKDVNVGELKIHSLENVRFPEEAREVKLLDKNILSKLTLAWAPSDANRLVEDKDLLGQLVPPRGLEDFVLNGYSSTWLPSWLMGISHYLPNLAYIYLEDMDNCSSLPPLGQLPNLKLLQLAILPRITKITKDFCGGKGAFHVLSNFTLLFMDGLELWNTTYSCEDGAEVFMFPMLDKLHISDCPRLRLKPRAPTFREFRISHSDQVISSLGEVDNISNLPSCTRSTKLEVTSSKCRSMMMLRHFGTLQELSFCYCHNLTSLPESMQRLSSLKSLELKYCDNISSLPEWLGDLSSLRSLDIKKCSLIKSLPPCIQQHTKLQKLRIEENSELKKWCESELRREQDETGSHEYSKFSTKILNLSETRVIF
ncbi:putative disease resistance protein RGA4 [Dichanthelium oligosanthes]|uniref:Putative disease resistance protein RGA4 n=1 Tax=Dichanthelium oligosanthes TaxID=888268 RepID=A0A1E5V3K3_9POAL|nr:putative disease resistance protein RGA4 [Dichanthelium oligosanthes]